MFALVFCLWVFLVAFALDCVLVFYAVCCVVFPFSALRLLFVLICGLVGVSMFNSVVILGILDDFVCFIICVLFICLCYVFVCVLFGYCLLGYVCRF